MKRPEYLVPRLSKSPTSSDCVNSSLLAPLSFRSLGALKQFNTNRSIKTLIYPQRADRFSFHGKQNFKTPMQKNMIELKSLQKASELLGLQSQTLFALKVQNQHLKTTMYACQEELKCSVKDNIKLRKQLIRLQSIERQRETQETEHKKKIEEQQNILPKLIELEELQEKLIAENKSLKEKNKSNDSLLTNIVEMIRQTQKNEGDETKRF